jgi:hypothetical protein
MRTLKVASDKAGFGLFPASIFHVPAPIGLRGVSVDNDTEFGLVTGLRGEQAHQRRQTLFLQEKTPMPGATSALSQVSRCGVISEAGKASCQSCDHRRPSGHT